MLYFTLAVIMEDVQFSLVGGKPLYPNREEHKRFILLYRNLDPYHKFKRTLHLTIFAVFLALLLFIVDPIRFLCPLLFSVISIVIGIVQTRETYVKWKRGTNKK